MRIITHHRAMAIACASFIFIFAGASCTVPTNTQKKPQQERRNAQERSGTTDTVKEGVEENKAEKKVTVALQAQNNSGQSGNVTLTETLEGKVYVEVRMEGVPSSIARPAHIHKGSCPKPGEVLHSLTNIVDERSESTLSATLAELAGEMPLAINVHKSFAELNVYVSCGDFPVEEMKAIKNAQTEAMMQKPEESAGIMMEIEGVKGERSAAGQYVVYSSETYEANKQQKRVLYFHATWCPTCKVVNQEFETSANTIPLGVVVLKTDYDTEKELKAKYGVTYQHTFVQVDAEGEAITKWNGGGVNELIANVK